MSAHPNFVAKFGLVCVVIIPSPLGRSHFEVVLASLRATCTLRGSWQDFEWSLYGCTGGGKSTGEHGGEVHSVRKLCSGLLGSGPRIKAWLWRGMSAGDCEGRVQC